MLNSGVKGFACLPWAFLAAESPGKSWGRPSEITPREWPPCDLGRWLPAPAPPPRWAALSPCVKF